jgi:hypothetical protein
MSSGLTAGQTTIGTDDTSAATGLAITSAVGMVSGISYTLYTVDVVDSAGQVVTAGPGASTSFTLSDNLANTSGAVAYFYGTSLSSLGVPTGTANAESDNIASTTSGTPLTTTDGQVQFAVETTTGLATPATITVTGADSFTGTALYHFAAPTPGYVAFLPNYINNNDELANYVFTPGQRGTVSAQLTDQYGTPVAEAGQPIWFQLQGEPSGLVTLPNGASQSGDVYEAFTNRQGLATMTFAMPSSDSTPSFEDSAFYFAAWGVASRSNPNGEGSLDYYVVPPASYATSLQLMTSDATVTGMSTDTFPSTNRFTAGSTVNGLEIQALNALGANVSGNDGGYYWSPSYPRGEGGDSLLVTSTNPAVASLSANSHQVYTSNQWLLNDRGQVYSDGVYDIPTLDLGQAGTATLTFTDISNNTMPSVSITVTVLPGAATNKPEIEYDGAAISSSNPVVLSPDVPQELSVVNVDAAGDPIATSSALTVTLPTAPTGTEWETSDHGVSSTSGTVTIPAGASSVPVWIVSSAAATLTGPLSGTD